MIVKIINNIFYILTSMLLLLVSPSYAANCIVNVHTTTKLGASAKGIVSAIYVDRSDYIKRDQILVEIDTTEEKAREALAKLRAEDNSAIETARHKAETSELRVKRLTTLNKRNFTSQAELDEAVLEARTARLEEKQAKLEKEIASLEVKSAKAALERKIIRSPYDGIVISKQISKGELYNEQDPLLVIAKIDPLYVETFLPLAEYNSIKIGDEINVTLETGQKVKGKISLTDAILDAATGTFGIRIEVPNPQGKILAGQRCEINFNQ
jgi:RND family efflux transporter MFP subunit